MSNSQKAVLWAIRTIKWGGGSIIALALIGACLCAAFSPTVPNEQAQTIIAIAAYEGGMAGVMIAAIPGCITVWFIFLHMVGQFSASVRGK